MTPRERMERVFDCKPADRVPFIPAVYEQKAFLIQDTPSRVARDPELLYRSMMVEYETYQADALVIGMDVYNVEAEALGSDVTFYEGDDTSIPGVGPGGHALHFGDDLSGIKIPNPLKDGRMPVNLEVARRLAHLNNTILVRGSVSGPFSLAISLMGPEDVFIGTLENPDYTRRALEFCADVIITFGKAYLDAGVGVIMFDSQASPELLSPDMYEELVLPSTQRIIRTLREHGDKYCPLIIGGNTTLMADAYLKTGTRQVLCDFKADFPVYREKCAEAKVAVRRNMNPMTIQKGTPEEIARTAERYLEEAAGLNGFIVGTAVVPYGTPTANVLAAREACVRWKPSTATA